ncbi:flagellar hook assembly protein FlgD [Clostridium putrefaciens]|uniref:Basal-body rod modification protein FlgD n=1 Tax=Clostridium putrefaciens TaxID=99675 RepID=A0A381J889_9CLOT|nr:flagellar hook capping FlgD N-terminal domain-containing protein [Clostridium putrefaciens]SUY47480.1 flagellar hook assembly protein FlgD [Clostridium putrefaciens]
MPGINNPVKYESKSMSVQDNYTSRRTKVVKNGGGLDKNSFLKILSAELSNQDPSNAKDTTAYIAQMAQFASLEQMTNLNNTVSSMSSSTLIGKGVTLNYADDNGKPYTGIVRATENRRGEMVLGVEVKKDDKTEVLEFALGDVISILDVPNLNVENINTNTSLLYASSLIGKQVELSGDKPDEVIKGLVTGVFREKGLVNVSVKFETGEIKDYSYTKINKISQ